MNTPSNLSPPESMTEAIARLDKLGYRETFRGEASGKLRALSNHDVYDAHDFHIDEVVRFEGDTNLEDESVIFALRHIKSDLKGTYTIAYSTNMQSEDLDVMQALQT